MLLLQSQKPVLASSTYSVSGKVLSANVPVSGVSISVSGQTVITNQNGEFSLSGLAGNIVLSLSKRVMIFHKTYKFQVMRPMFKFSQPIVFLEKFFLAKKQTQALL